MALEDRAREAFIAEHLMGYRPQSVGKDYDGKNDCEVLVPPTGVKGYSYPPRGVLSRWYHVPHWTTDERNTWELIRWMKQHGSSLVLNWGEDNDCWEVSWISSGDRFVGIHEDMATAVVMAVEKAAAAKAAVLMETR